MKRCPRGSEWRKWDLHIHVPGTKLNNGFGDSQDLDRYCKVLEESDVAAFGITDYFSVDKIISVLTRYAELYPNSEKALFPNIELRLNETVNGSNQDVNIHTIFRSDVSNDVLKTFIGELKTEVSNSSGRKIPCGELIEGQFDQATVTRASLKSAIENTFGEKVVRSENVIVVVPANNDGIRAASGALRKANLADEIDKFADAIFGNPNNTEYFLGTARFEDKMQKSKPKPVLAGSDAHSFEQLEQWLGKEDVRSDSRKHVTWIKADPTFEGLQQILVEPKQRIRLQVGRPDTKEPYQYISKVSFSGSNDFPAEIHLNQNLVSIIGPRSSGKSALLAYIAYSIDAEHVVAQQVAANLVDANDAGPAAGKTWASVASIKCDVEWGDPAVKIGKIIYVPQNSLYAISERPHEITAKIQPALHRLDERFASVHLQATADIHALNERIRTAVAGWFDLAVQLSDAYSNLRDLGDKGGIVSTRDSLAAKILALQSSSALTQEETAEYQAVVHQIAAKDLRIKMADVELRAISSFFPAADQKTSAQQVSVRIELNPSTRTFPVELQTRLDSLIAESQRLLVDQVTQAIASYRDELASEVDQARKSIEEVRDGSRELIERSQAHTELDVHIQAHRKQEQLLETIASHEAGIVQLVKQQEDFAAEIVDKIAKRKARIKSLETAFASAQKNLADGMSFGMENAVAPEAGQALARAFNMRDAGDYVDRALQRVKFEYAQDDPRQFLQQMYRGDQKLKRGEDPATASASVLTVTPEIRFYASLDGDRIGGFEPSSMTPGKQALFALTLILNESSEAWPLLIDQPEDDLDSRSVYEQIVPYLASRKVERQILMVSHNANLVIGADSEQIIVANRHGEDRENRAHRTFDYVTGSLEHSQPAQVSPYILQSRGIREHACEILDGGEEAFRKRGSKYKV